MTVGRRPSWPMIRVRPRLRLIEAALIWIGDFVENLATDWRGGCWEWPAERRAAKLQVDVVH